MPKKILKGQMSDSGKKSKADGLGRIIEGSLDTVPVIMSSVSIGLGHLRLRANIKDWKHLSCT